MTKRRSAEQAHHEEMLVRVFILPARRSRYLYLISRPKRREDLIRALAHFPHLDPRYCRTIPSSHGSASGILTLLEELGAPRTCWAVSELRELDGQQMELAEALSEILGSGMGTFLSCLPGQLAYFEDEDSRLILSRAKMRMGSA